MLWTPDSLVDTATLGRGFGFPFRKSVKTGGLVRTSGADTPKACILCILSCRVGERVFNEDFGLEIPPLFSSLEAMIDILPVRAKEAILRWEPRVYSVQTQVAEIGTTGVQLDVTYWLRSTGAQDSVVYPYYLNPAGATYG